MPSPQDDFRDLLSVDRTAQELTVTLGGARDQSGVPWYRSAQLSNKLRNQFIGLVFDFLGKKARRNDRREFVLRGYQPQYTPGAYEVTWIRISDDENLRSFFSSIPSPSEATTFDESDDSLKGITFFIVNAKTPRGRLIRSFRTLTSAKKLSTAKGLLAKVVGRRFETLEEQSLMFNPDFQAVSYGDYLFIFSQYGFEVLFQFYESLRTEAESTLETIQSIVPIANFEAFKADALEHLVKVRKLRNIKASAYLPELRMDRLKETIRDCSLPIRIVRENGQEKLEYNPDEPWVLLELLEDQFVRSITTDKKYAANSKREIS